VRKVFYPELFMLPGVAATALNGMRVQLPAICPDDQIVSGAHEGLYFGSGILPLVESLIRNSLVNAERSASLPKGTLIVLRGIGRLRSAAPVNAAVVGWCLQPFKQRHPWGRDRPRGRLLKAAHSLRILVESVFAQEADPEAALKVICARSKEFDIPFRPARVVLQDLLGTPALVDLVGPRDAVAERGGNPRLVNLVTATHLVMDHSLNVERWGDASALADNEAIERERKAERFQFLDWCNKHSATYRSSPRAKASFIR
jgi:hypothetical protein